jgi:hypothetical protein
MATRSNNKRHYCRYAAQGCGGSCFGLKRIKHHEASCRFAPETSPVGAMHTAMIARISAFEDVVSGLVRSDASKTKQILKLVGEMKNLRIQILDLQSNVSKIVPDYSHVELRPLYLHRLIMKYGGDRQWATMMRDRCKYDNPKYLFAEFFKYLVKTEPFFYKVKSYDTLAVNVDFGEGRREGHMLLRDFAVQFCEACYMLMTDLWNVTEINKIPHVPRLLCFAHTKAIVRRLKKANFFVEAQYAETHQAEIMQSYHERVESIMELARAEFTAKYRSKELHSFRT